MVISKELVEKNKAEIRCPGIPESIWQAYQNYQREHPETVKSFTATGAYYPHDDKDPLYIARKDIIPGYQGYFPASWQDDQGRIAPPGVRTPRAEVLARGKEKVPKKLNFWSTGTRKSLRPGQTQSQRSATSVVDTSKHPPKDWLKIFPECLPTRSGFKDNIRTSAIASNPPMDYRRKSVRNARGNAFAGATVASITLQ